MYRPSAPANRRSALPAGLVLPCALLVFLILAIMGCGTEPEPTPLQGAWRRTDLWFDRPRLELADGNPASRPVHRLTMPLEGTGVWSELPAPRKGQGPPPAGDIHALEQWTGTQLVAALALGEEAFFSFVPLPAGEGVCPCTFRVGLRGEPPLWEGILDEADDGLRFAPETIVVDLGAFAGRSIELVLEVEAASTATSGGSVPAYWGSPAVYDRLEPIVAGPEEAAPKRPNVLLVGVDTLRADALGAWGREPTLTPTLDRLAAESDVFLKAFSTFNATNPSFSSIHTGLYGKHHGTYDNRTRFAADIPTLAERFKAGGYATGAVLAARHLSWGGFNRGFDDLVECDQTFSGELPVDFGMAWIAPQEGPFFLWLHLFDPHTPHTPPRPFALGYRAERPFGLGAVESWQSFREPGPVSWVELVHGGAAELYDGEVAYVDRQVDRLLDFLASRRLLESTIVVFVADHGENLEDHGIRYGHGGLWDTTTHVPMMIRWPRPMRPTEANPGRRIGGLVQTIDLFPTLLGAAGLEIPPQDGLDLLQLADADPPGRPVIFTEHANGHGAMVRTPRAKLIRSEGVPGVPDGDYLYDLRRDPGELHNLAEEKPELREELGAILERWLAETDRSLTKAQEQGLAPEDIEKLRALGYL